MTCHNCRIDAPKHGRHRNGLQRYRCNQCGKTLTEAHEEPFRVEDHLADPRGLLAIQMIVEGSSIRSTERITGLHRNTITQLIVIAGERCEALMSSKIQNVPVSDVQCDEVWTFVQKKEAKRTLGDRNFHAIGDAWTFIGIERHSKLVLAFHLAKRNTMATCQFIAKLARATSDQRFQITTDGWVGYNYAIGTELDGRCDYAKLVKIYAQETPESQRRYSPARMVEAIPTEVYGEPERKRISTSHVERQNGSLRQWCKRLTRLTYAFSKKWENLRAALALHFCFYNFCRQHSSLGKRTPAMAAGITDRVWDLRELLGN